MRALISVSVIAVMALLFGRAAALMLDDGLLGAMAGLMLFLPLLVMAGPMLEAKPARIRLPSRRREGIEGWARR